MKALDAQTEDLIFIEEEIRKHWSKLKEGDSGIKKSEYIYLQPRLPVFVHEDCISRFAQYCPENITETFMDFLHYQLEEWNLIRRGAFETEWDFEEQGIFCFTLEFLGDVIVAY